MAAYRLGVDIGGTFTDLVILTPDGRLEKRKIPSTPDDYAEAIIAGIPDALGGDGHFYRTPVTADMVLTKLEQIAEPHSRLMAHV